jgi:adenylate kinase family enzyme
LLDYYAAQHKLLTVNGNQSIEQVTADLLRAVNERRKKGSS